jgi:coenzyme F420-reducing hydrogenase alpha subunit
MRPLAVLGLIARARHLLKKVHTTADVGDVLGSALASRAINESVMTLGWFSKDPELAELVWMLDEIRSRLSHHREAAAEERRQRRRAKRRGEPVTSLAAGKSLGILERKTVRDLRKRQAESKRTRRS